MFIKETIMIGSIGYGIFKEEVERVTVYCIRSLTETMNMTSDEVMSY